MLRQLGNPLPDADYVHNMMALLHIAASRPNTAGSIFESYKPWELRKLGNITVDLEGALRQCFSSSYRSPSLGLRHVDKGLYWDQVLRWQHAFPHSPFVFLPSKWLEDRPKEVVRYLLQWMNASHVDVPHAMNRIDWTERRLQRPNQLQQSASEELTKQLQLFFAPYNTALESLLVEAA